MSELHDEDVFPEESDIDESDIEGSEIDAGEVDANANEVDEDANEVGVDEEDANANEIDANEIDANEVGEEDEEDSANLQGGAKKKSGEESEDEEESSSDSSSEAGAVAGLEANEELSSSGSDSDDDEDYLQKFNKSMRDDLIMNFHPESKSHNYEEIKQLAKVMRNKNGIIVDELHKTIPILTKYEKTRILGQRAKQIETGAIPLIQVPPNIIDSYLIAKLELAQNKIPFIIRRPLPNGGMEYWYVSDLENL
jgi:DNA-directed RNA polymerase I, II, and III subunit RPABC2